MAGRAARRAPTHIPTVLPAREQEPIPSRTVDQPSGAVPLTPIRWPARLQPPHTSGLVETEMLERPQRLAYDHHQVITDGVATASTTGH